MFVHNDLAALAAQDQCLRSGLQIPEDIWLIGDDNTSLTEWGMDEPQFTTEPIVSELVNDALRHGSAPIRLLLMPMRSTVADDPGHHTGVHPQRDARWRPVRGATPHNHTALHVRSL
ncbi:substrate-binding domain-containing protein [Streptomyces sp. NPDC101393]|uniref:substrate-binding domain-containing protein n=1 Tax=Streptomyces sp. NPDC101393 TaxID=3366141 RepID=UPI0038169312